jgi:hypothetical protein
MKRTYLELMAWINPSRHNRYWRDQWYIRDAFNREWDEALTYDEMRELLDWRNKELKALKDRYHSEE